MLPIVTRRGLEVIDGALGVALLQELALGGQAVVQALRIGVISVAAKNDPTAPSTWAARSSDVLLRSLVAWPCDPVVLASAA